MGYSIRNISLNHRHVGLGSQNSAPAYSYDCTLSVIWIYIHKYIQVHTCTHTHTYTHTCRSCIHYNLRGGRAAFGPVCRRQVSLVGAPHRPLLLVGGCPAHRLRQDILAAAAAEDSAGDWGGVGGSGSGRGKVWGGVGGGRLGRYMRGWVWGSVVSVLGVE